MKTNVLKKLLDEGKQPMVRLTDSLWDESFGQKGMIAKVASVSIGTDGLFQFKFDFNDKREHNLALDKPSWWIGSEGKKGTAIEAGQFEDPNNIHEDVYFDEDQDIEVELVGDQTPLALYVSSGSKLSYVEWLEGKLEELVPDCMKEWKKGL